MTLPLISYGGSSTIALCLGVGFLLAITRRNPFITRERFKGQFARSLGDKAMSAAFPPLRAGRGRHRRTPDPRLSRWRPSWKRRGHHVALITDERGAAIPGKPASLTAHVLPAGRLQGKNPLQLDQGIARSWKGRAWRCACSKASTLRRCRLRRLSGVAGAAGRRPALDSERDPRTERGAGPGQPLPCGPGRCHRHGLSRG
jgi:hypothetical protein